MQRLLHQRTVLVTRERSQAAALSGMLADQGAVPIECPMIVLAPPDDWTSADRALACLPQFNGVIFTSVNGVRFFLDRARERGTPLDHVRKVPCFAVGPATEKALEERNIPVQPLPERFQAEGLVALFEKERIQGKRFLIPRAKKAREILPRFLEDRGARVDVAIVYQTRRASENRPLLRRILSETNLDYLTFTSASTVRYFAEMADAREIPCAWKSIPAGCIGDITAEEAHRIGFQTLLVARQATLVSLVQILAEDSQAREKANR